MNLKIQNINTGEVHKYGDDPFDSIFIDVHGGLHYYNMMDGGTTQKDGCYVWCDEEGKPYEASLFLI